MKCVAQKKGEPFVNLFKNSLCILIEYAKVSVTRSLYDEYIKRSEVMVHKAHAMIPVTKVTTVLWTIQIGMLI